MVAAAFIAWLGLLVHNVADLPGQTLLSPETLGPTLVTAALLATYATGLLRLAGIGLYGWALLNAVGGTLSVLPLSVLPFEPEQTLRHYSFHLLYAATQVPLLVVSYHLVLGPRAAPSREAARITGPQRDDLGPASDAAGGGEVTCPPPQCDSGIASGARRG